MVTGRHLFCFGLGYSARALGRRLIVQGWTVTGTCRGGERTAALRQAGFQAMWFARDRPLGVAALDGVSHIIVSIPPDRTGDPVLDLHLGEIARLPGLCWLGYLSTTGVYGDRGGGWVDEGDPPAPSGERGRQRLIAETG